jgi:hypothetical protein
LETPTRRGAPETPPAGSNARAASRLRRHSRSELRDDSEGAAMEGTLDLSNAAAMQRRRQRMSAFVRTAAIVVAMAATAWAGDAVPPAQGAVAKAQTPARTAEQIATLRKLVLEGLANQRLSKRAEACELLVTSWPDSAPILDEALASKTDTVRLEAVRLLARPELGDVRDRVQPRFKDAIPSVRVQAVRVARHMTWPEVERDFIRLVSEESSWEVRQEALRGLEDLGTKKCLTVVFAGWSNEEDPARRRRYRRVLVKILAADHGDDAAKWADAIEAARRVAAR